MIETVWLAALLAGLGIWTVHGNRQYAAFRQLTDSDLRAAFYRRWTVESFVALTGVSAITLWMLGQPGAPFSLPEAFRPLSAALAPKGPTHDDAGTMIGLAIGAALGLSVLVAVYYFRLKRAIDAVSGDIEPLLPRNRMERLWSVPLCLNAGFSEELFFRLALPLLATQVTGSALAGFLIAGVAFGLMHAYQGWKGVLGTTFLGALFTLHYLEHGSLLWLMIVHAGIDLMAMIARPLIAARFGPRRQVAIA